VLNKSTVVVVVLWLNRQLIPRRQRPRLKSKQRPGLLRPEVSGCFYKISSTHGILEGVPWNLLHSWMMD